MSAKSASLAAKASASSASIAAAASASSASSLASKSGTSLASQAGTAASQASASLSSGAAKASSYAGNLANDLPTKTAAGIFSLSTLTLTALAIALGAAYYNGYLDGLIAYIQQLMGQAQEQKERTLKEITGHTSVRSAASDAMKQGTARTEEMVDALHAKAQNQETGRVQNVKLDGPATLISDGTKV